jgi:hypothetical protein
MSLQYTVDNSTGSETNASIQNKAPQAYYTQNRMVTAEDYNITPLTLGADIVKVKSINRVSSGLSKYFELSDVSGRYSKTNIFATDGILYKDTTERNFEFSYSNNNDIIIAIKEKLEPIIASESLRSFYLENYSRPALDNLDASWVAPVTGQPKGYFKDSNNPLSVGPYTSNNLKYVKIGALIKFAPPAGRYFTKTGKLVPSQGVNTVDYIWTKVLQVAGDGANSGIGALDDGTGPIVLSNVIPSTATPVEVIPKFIDIFTYAFETELVTLCQNHRNFGLSFNQITRVWNIVLDTNLDLTNPFSLAYQGNVTNSNKDASWLVAFTWTGKNYKVRHRLTDYIFESEKETAFFVDDNTVNYDFVSNTIVKDQITVLSINTDPENNAAGLGVDYRWQIDNSIVEVDGYVDPKKVRVSFYDLNDGQITDPDTFNNVSSTGTIYFKTLSDGIRYQLEDSDLFTVTYPTPADADVDISNDDISPATGDLFYFSDPAYNVVNSYSTATGGWVYESDYTAYPGRSGLKFHYVHNSSEDRRIDPSKSNIIDIYLLTASYDNSYRSWLASSSGTEPLAPTSQNLELNFGGLLDPVKTISDEIVFQPVKYKVLFGNKAATNLQSTFKAVKNSSRPISDNEIKSRILVAIQDFFSLENWDFGQTFYFSELATYVMNVMTPDITNFVIIPKSNNDFGSLYEVACLSNELFISGATADDIEVIDAITASQLKTSSIVTTSGT